MSERYAPAIRLHPSDDVAVAIRAIAPGEAVTLPGIAVTASAEIAAGHKIAVRRVEAGALVRKYGQVIGIAREAIAPGEHVHLHNLGLDVRRDDYEFGTDIHVPERPADAPATFDGFRRGDGRVGTRNYVAVIATVNCAASAVRRIADLANERLAGRYPNVDGVIGLTHKNGCAAPIGGPDYRLLQRTLAGYADHPNVGAALFVGLGCEGNQAAALVDDTGLLHIAHGETPPIVTLQESGGLERAVETGLAEVERLLAIADRTRRTPEPIGKILVGLQCGGSDGASGITANPALGRAVDMLVACGGTAALAETPEIYGAEHLLVRRAASRAVGERLLEHVRWWEWYTGIWGADLDANPAPGNKAGGLTTIFEKSLGAVAKGGTSPLCEVRSYADRMNGPGLVFMDTPGYDPASVTGLVAGGATLIAFTTGRGSCFGSVPSPTIKIATNTPLARRMPDDMDIDAGVILDGAPLDRVAGEIFRAFVDVASGRRTKSECQGIGEEEFAPWVLGPVL